MLDYKNQKTFDNNLELMKAIVNAQSARALNELRAAVVNAKDKNLLETWQKQYWHYKK
jgi:hypothetical protein